LILAFAMARLGDDRECRRLQALAHAHLDDTSLPQPEVHAALLEAFDFRLRQALESRSAAGPLPPEWLKRVGEMEHMTRYKVDKLREYSRVLEPHVKIDPYQRFQVRYHGDLDKALIGLQDVADRQQLQDDLRLLLAQAGRKTAEEKERWVRILTAGLVLAPRVGEALAEELLDEVAPACELLAELAKSRKKGAAADEAPAFLEQANLLEKALVLAAHFNQTRRVQEFVGRFRKALQAQHGPAALKALSSVAAQSFRGLRKLGLRDEIDHLLRQMAEVILQGRTMSALRGEKHWPEMLPALLRVAEGWYYFGKEAEADGIVEEARRLLYKEALHPHQQYPVALAYVAALTEAPVEQALQGIEELFNRLERVRDGFSTNTHFGVRQLFLIESVVLAVVSEDFAGGAQARRWLDDEEYLIRKRVHQDVAAVMQRGAV
jgi:hypothetical protein